MNVGAGWKADVEHWRHSNRPAKLNEGQIAIIEEKCAEP